MKGKNKMKKWIDEIAADFVNDLIKKSKQPTDMLKAQEVHDYIGSKTSEELAIVRYYRASGKRFSTMNTIIC